VNGMATKSNRSYIAIFGGIVAILGIVLSIFIKELGWWNLLAIIGSDVNYTDIFTTAFFGDNSVYFNSELTYLLPGIIAGVGGLLCLPGNKFLSLVGGVAVLAGIVVFMILLGDSWVGDVAELAGNSPFWGGVLFFKWRLGIGFFITGGGGLLAIIGAAIAPKK
jgi:hypothetical protein